MGDNNFKGKNESIFDKAIDKSKSKKNIEISPTQKSSIFESAAANKKSSQMSDGKLSMFASKKTITISPADESKNNAIISSKISDKSTKSVSSTDLLKKYIENQKKTDIVVQQKPQVQEVFQNQNDNQQQIKVEQNTQNQTNQNVTDGVKDQNPIKNNGFFKPINKMQMLKNLVHQNKTSEIVKQSEQREKDKEEQLAKQRELKRKENKQHKNKEQNHKDEIEIDINSINKSNSLGISINIGSSSTAAEDESEEISNSNENSDIKGKNRDNSQINKILNEFEYEEFDNDISDLIEGKNLRAMIESMRDDSVSFDDHNDVAAETSEEDRKKASKNTKFKQFKRPKRQRPQVGFVAQQAFVKKTAIVYDSISVIGLAKQISVKTKDIEKILVSLGINADEDEMIDFETAEIVVAELGHDIKKATKVDEISDEYDDHKKQIQICSPVVTIMGHVDHGKTTLLDTIRKADVALKEHGGITQSIGAYKVTLESGAQITFLDTPGHAAFSKMRIRGANATNIVVLVVAADDGIMQQTAEAISHAKSAGVPIIVAINKIDSPGADIKKVKNDLLKHELITEDLGGDVMTVEVSAKFNTNIDKLLETILLQAEVLDIKKDIAAKPSGMVLEANIEKAKGIACTILLQNGTLKKGDIIVAGESFGKIRQIVDDTDKQFDTIIPQTPVKVFGFSSLPKAGDKFFFAKSERVAKQITDYKKYKSLNAKNVDRNAIHADNSKKQINLVIKADSQGSLEAIQGFVSQVETPSDVVLKIIHQGIGSVNESDILLARGNNAFIFAFATKIESKCERDIKTYSIYARCHNIIYQIFDDIKALIDEKKEKVKIYTKIGTAEIREIFNISGRGKIAGCMVLDGIIKQKSVVKVIRGGQILHEGIVSNLKRLKENVAEVNQGFECGIQVQDFEEIIKQDILEIYEVKESAN